MEMGIVVQFQYHADASLGKKSLAVTAPAVSREMRSATSREGQPEPSQSEVTQPAVTPMRSAKSPRLIPLASKYSARRMGIPFSLAKTLAQEKFHPACMVSPPISCLDFSMGKGPRKPKAKAKSSRERRKERYQPSLVRAWRKYRGLSIEKLAEKTAMTAGNLSNIETGVQGYTQGNLETLAEALDCTVAELLVRDPNQDEDIFVLWYRASPEDRPKIARVVKAMLMSVAA
jgi:DNA-binding Xre family transcriptional regulator